jgi:uncharacterized membrane protein YfcA
LVPALIAVAGSSTGFVGRQQESRWRPMLVGAMAGLLGTALGFRLYPHGPHDPLHPWHEVGLPYISVVVAAALWPLVLGPPRRPEQAATAVSS